MACDNCKTGFNWEGDGKGKETTMGKHKVYVTGESKSAAILLVHDLFGWTFTNLRLLADHFAEEANATVWLPDFFEGEIVSPDVFDDPPKRTAFSLPDFISRHSKAIRYPQIKEVAQILKSEYPKVGAIGYCYGGWAVFKLGGEPGLIDAASAAHPSLLTKDEISGIKVPVQILAAETDPAFTQELKKYSNKTLPTIGVPYEYIFFPKVAHGFAARGDPVDAVQREALERAKNSAVNFFKEFLL